MAPVSRSFHAARRRWVALDGAEPGQTSAWRTHTHTHTHSATVSPSKWNSSERLRKGGGRGKKEKYAKWVSFRHVSGRGGGREGGRVALFCFGYGWHCVNSARFWLAQPSIAEHPSRIPSIRNRPINSKWWKRIRADRHDFHPAYYDRRKRKDSCSLERHRHSTCVKRPHEYDHSSIIQPIYNDHCLLASLFFRPETSL